jgi:hypothetical protein
MKKLVDTVVSELNQILLGKEQQVRLALCGLLARGHLLIEDIPGMGKTTLSHALAKVMGLSYQRIQFTNDLLPADVLGYSMYDKQAGSLVFHPGPIFAQVVLADEINRASPRTQSALLEAMEERQVSIEGETRPLPHPFFVIATQNPIEQGGTYPLPESQLDRFLMRLHLGYPDPRAERELLEGEDRRTMTEKLPTLLPGRPENPAGRCNKDNRQPGASRLRAAIAGTESENAGPSVRAFAPRRPGTRPGRQGLGAHGRSASRVARRHPGSFPVSSSPSPRTGGVGKKCGTGSSAAGNRFRA